MEQLISTLGLSKIITKRLRDVGYINVSDLENANLESLNLSIDVIKEIREALQIKCAQSALDIWQEECKLLGIPTFCKELDLRLGNGIPLSSVTEFCGAPGSGKTQFCLQLSVNVQIPEEFGGLNGDAVFIDSNSSFTPHRLLEIGEECISFCKEIIEHSSQTIKALEQFTTDSILQRVHYFQAKNYIELLAAVQHLKKFLQDNKKIKLVVIDSFSFPFRYGIDMMQRTRLLSQLIRDLQEIADKFNIAVVITNEITTRIFGGYDGLVPALGDSHAHLVPLRLLLGTTPDGLRAVLVDKCVYLPQITTPFEISKKGIRGP